MPIQFKSKLSSAVANATFLDKTIDDLKKGKLSLYKVDVSETGFIDDVQNYINELADIDGVSGEGDASAKNYSSEEIIANGDDRKVAIGKLDAQVKVNLDDIASVEAILDAGEVIIKAYADDASYEAENGAVPFIDKTAIYYNTTSGLLRYYNDVDSEWADVGKSAIGEHEFLGYGNGALVDFNVTKLPLTDESFIVFKNGILVPDSEYTFSNPTITFTTAPSVAQRIDVWMLTEGKAAVAPITPSGTQEVGYQTLDATAITNKEFTLPSTPAVSTKVMLDLIGGSAQVYGTDFTVSGDVLSWNGLTLESELTEGSILRYNYFS